MCKIFPSQMRCCICRYISIHFIRVFLVFFTPHLAHSLFLFSSSMSIRTTLSVEIMLTSAPFSHFIVQIKRRTFRCCGIRDVVVFVVVNVTPSTGTADLQYLLPFYFYLLPFRTHHVCLYVRCFHFNLSTFVSVFASFNRNYTV